MVIELGRGDDVVSVIFVSLAGEDGLPVTVAIAVLSFLDKAFTFPAEYWNDTGRLVFVDGVPRREHYLRCVRAIHVHQDGAVAVGLRPADWAAPTARAIGACDFFVADGLQRREF